MKTYNLITFGCQMNEHDSERMKGMLDSLGYREIADREVADLITARFVRLLDVTTVRY